MNYSQPLCVLLICNLLNADNAYEEWKKKEREQWFAERQSWIEHARATNDGESMEKLARIVNGVGKRLSTADTDERSLYNAAVHILISTPGHARHFADKLREARAQTDEPWMSTEYNDRYRYTKDVLSHLPSPETVWVLGEMLESEEDIKSREEKVRIWESQDRAGGERYLLYPRALAAQALRALGVRGLPPLERAQPSDPTPLPRGSGAPFWKASHRWWNPALVWWAEVKSGQRAFSFKGQAVEYRFNPDGSVTSNSIEIPDGEGERREAAVHEISSTGKKPNEEPAVQDLSVPEFRRSPWRWIVFASAVLAMAFGFHKMRK